VSAADDAWRNDDLGWFRHVPGVDDEPLAAELAPLASPNASTNALGIDCASYQGVPNFVQVAASGRSFCYLKSSDGASSSYPSLDPQYQGATAAGMITGLYHYAQPALTPEANADAFSAQVNRLGAIVGHLPPCLDLETGSGNLSSWAQRFVTRLRANTGCIRVMVYSNASFFQNQITESWMDSNIALWIASWGTAPGKPSYTSPRVALHQYSSTGLVSGIAGNVDLSYAIWPLSTLVPGSEAPPVTTPPAASATSVLTADEQAKLTACYQQFSGSSVVGQWPGWASWPSGSGRSLTLVDYCRQNDVAIVALKDELDAIKAQPSAMSGALSDTDVTRIATAVADLMASRMQNRP
jgi:GH25 family lysozyme M1 (1,4-beta-N-acetylmuramidase)